MLCTWAASSRVRPTKNLSFTNSAVVTPVLVRRVREALDDAGHERVKIVASGGFDAARIREFEREDVPVDAYGVGSSLLRGQNDFTADVVVVDGEHCSKVGRRHRPNPRLGIVE